MSFKQSGLSQRSALNTVIAIASLGVSLSVAFVLTPLIYGATAGWVQNFAVNHYGPAMGGLAAFGWGLMILVTVFGSAAAICVTLLKSAALAVGSRLSL